MSKKKSEFQIEQAFTEIEEIISQLESEEVPLKESISLYAKGAKLLAECKRK